MPHPGDERGRLFPQLICLERKVMSDAPPNTRVVKRPPHSMYLELAASLRAHAARDQVASELADPDSLIIVNG